LQSRVAETPSRQEIFDVLRNQRRQHIIRYVEQNGTNRPFELSDLVDYVTAREPGTAENGNSPTERKRVYNTLRQTHLPKLDEMGILDYDPKTNRIAFTESAADARLYLERAPGNDTPASCATWARDTAVNRNSDRARTANRSRGRNAGRKFPHGIERRVHRALSGSYEFLPVLDAVITFIYMGCPPE